MRHNLQSLESIISVPAALGSFGIMKLYSSRLICWSQKEDLVGVRKRGFNWQAAKSILQLLFFLSEENQSYLYMIFIYSVT